MVGVGGGGNKLCKRIIHEMLIFKLDFIVKIL
jgi:cell division GTPase FtsZ